MNLSPSGAHKPTHSRKIKKENQKKIIGREIAVWRNNVFMCEWDNSATLEPHPSPQSRWLRQQPGRAWPSLNIESMRATQPLLCLGSYWCYNHWEGLEFSNYSSRSWWQLWMKPESETFPKSFILKLPNTYFSTGDMHISVTLICTSQGGIRAL